MTVSTLKGEQGHQRQGDREAARRGCATSRGPTWSTSPTRCSSRWRARSKRALERRADRRDAAGRGPVPRRPARAVPSRGAGPDPRARRRRRSVRRGQRVLRRLHAATIWASRPRRCASRRSASRCPRACAPAPLAPGAVHHRLLRPGRAGKGPPRPRRGLHASCGASSDCRRRACAPPGTGARISRPTSTASCASWRPRASPASSNTRARPDRGRQVRIPAAPWTCSPCPARITSPKALYLLEAMAAGVPVVVAGTRRAPRNDPRHRRGTRHDRRRRRRSRISHTR